MTHLPEGLPELPQPPLSHVENWGDSSEVIGEYEAIEWAKAYGLACYRAGLELAATICDARVKSWGGDPPDGQEREWGWMRDEAENCAAAIRSEKSPS